ncbi:DUF4261 domain-containing protein [Dongia sp.]|uniref:DUF4261 domain-containing protein n=1 Tax=Dongia sp. TaxID=1977262 RepID=UPI0035B077C1
MNATSNISEEMSAQKRFTALVTLGESQRISAFEIAREIGRIWPSQRNSIRASVRDDDGALLLYIDGVVVVVVFFDQPASEDAISLSNGPDPVWPEAKEALAPQRAHALVTTLDSFTKPKEAFSCALAMTLVGISLVHLLESAIGLHWIGAGVGIPASRAKELGVELARGVIPTELWLRLYLIHGGDDSSVGAMTKGLIPFAGREIEIDPVRMKPRDVSARAVSLSNYLLQNGPVLKDGETAGVTGQEKFRIHLVNSARVRGLPVFHLMLE